MNDTAERPLRGLHSPSHPGEVLREVTLPSLKLTKTDFAARLRVSRQTLHELLDCRRALTASMALRLGKLLDVDPQFWMNLQSAYDLAQARAEIGPEIDSIEKLEAVEIEREPDAA